MSGTIVATPAQVADGMMAFAEADILPALTGWQLWTAGAALILMRQRAEDMVASLAGNKAAATLGLVDSNGNIDVDAVIDAAKEAARKHGKLAVDVPLLGVIKLGEDNFETLRGCLARAVGGG